MKIALVAPIEETVPPRAYGGVELVVHLLDRGLSERGHEVVLFAAGGSRATGRLETVAPAALEPRAAAVAGGVAAPKEAAERRVLERLRAERFDIVHNHTWRLVRDAHLVDAPLVTTVHTPLRGRGRQPVFARHPQLAYVSVSRSQQSAAPGLRWVANVHHGIDIDAYRFQPRPDGYLAFLGRAAPEKGLAVAVRVAQRAGLPLRIAAKVDERDTAHFRAEIEPALGRDGIELLGELGPAAKEELLRGALALLHPSRWSEPFGVAVVEAMACGTPVIAHPRGAIPELVLDGVTGLLAADEDGLVRAVERVGSLDRAGCRARVEERFSYRRMAAEYERVYEWLLARSQARDVRAAARSR